MVFGARGQQARSVATTFRRIWVLCDESERSDRAVEVAAALARPIDALLTLVHVARDDVPATTPAEGIAGDLVGGSDVARWEARLAETAAGIPDVRTSVRIATGEMPTVLRLQIAAAAPDLVVVGTRGVGRPYDQIRGGVGQFLLSEGRVPVLLVGRRAGPGTGRVTVTTTEPIARLRTAVGMSRLGRVVNRGENPVLVLPRR